MLHAVAQLCSRRAAGRMAVMVEPAERAGPVLGWPPLGSILRHWPRTAFDETDEVDQ
jgi:hypothetical protein